MTQTSWESLSNQAVAAAGVVYFLALLAYLAEWALLRQVPVAATRREAIAVGGRAASDTATEADDETNDETNDASAASEVSSEVSEQRIAMAGRLGLLLTALACAVHLVAMVARGMAAEPHRVPWGNMYEFTLSGTFVVTLLFLATRRRFRTSWMGPLVVGFVLVLLMVAVLWLYQPVAPLMEALDSYWLVIHVVSAVIATGAFTLGGITSVLYLVQDRAERRGIEHTRGYLSRVPDTVTLDRVSYRMHAFAFPVWTFAVLITGPIWAHQAWASYWNWDPKEVWAFITWVVYAAYLHARATAGWKGRNAAILALVGVGTLWFNFIGINYFSTSSMHSYARADEAPALLTVATPGT
ncbi:c-type cytochrome biogenesis protein CcsB [Nocardioides acrostichi]|uniref:C-type cytochrome biogenesis protein CcsB n=1 Tax=Nocardioides acrostichi TaxID=2784339 RepID=A0A930V515_9ACTN|nr:c-type cytochrome biogenesis protein CcsB [Nocardioides acrostichi]MBF4163875.1 c-type cytochrome biogenesis protein CcsB [Nocardioides acrostichi]